MYRSFLFNGTFSEDKKMTQLHYRFNGGKANNLKQ